MGDDFKVKIGPDYKTYFYVFKKRKHIKLNVDGIIRDYYKCLK